MTIRVYCGTYHKYNCGSLAGEWIDLGQFDSAEEFYAYCRELHKDERDPEFMFQDYECPSFLLDLIGESYLSDNLWGIMEFLDDKEDDGQFQAFIDCFGYDLEKEDIQDVWDKCEEAYIGEFEGDSDLGYEVLVQCGIEKVPEHLQGYIDYAKYGRDLQLGGDVSMHDGHAFWANH